MRTLFLLLLTSFAISRVQAQLLDSIALFAQERPRPVLRLDMKGSFVSNQNVRMMGVKLGLEHARRFQYGAGYSFLFSPVERDRFVHGLGTRPTRLRMGYVHAYVDYAFYQRGPWEVRIPVQVGVGSGSVVYDDQAGRRQKLFRSGFIIYEPCMTVQYRFWKYFGLGAGWGYRLVMRTGHSLDERLTAPIYTLGLRIFFEDVYRDLDKQLE
ncbi:MAG: hypothetical protein JNM62_15120 [Flavobacteriales bacterium]|nr:hypothetical protein [Flavobacteriales bacterium]